MCASDKNMEELLKKLYCRNGFLIINPSLHAEDSPWKVSKIIPLIDRFTKFINKDEVNLLDAGGGAGLIIKAVSTYFKENHKITAIEVLFYNSDERLWYELKRYIEFL